MDRPQGDSEGSFRVWAERGPHYGGPAALEPKGQDLQRQSRAGRQAELLQGQSGPQVRVWEAVYGHYVL